MDRITQLRISAALILIAGLVIARPAFASTPQVSMVGPLGAIHQGDAITVEVTVNSQGTRLNLLDIVLHYSPTYLRLDHVGREQSVLNYWLADPQIDNSTGQLRLVGGRPNGFIAINASVATLYFTVQKTGSTTVGVDQAFSAAYVHNGQGTAVSLEGSSLPLDILPAGAAAIVLTSSTHPQPDDWSSGQSIDVSWPTTPDFLYSYQLSTDRLSEPDTIPEKETGHQTYDNLDDGIYYFTIKFRDPTTTTWSAVTQRRFLLDHTPPEPFIISYIPAQQKSASAAIGWQAVDHMSGIVSSTLSVDSKSLGPVTSPLNLQPRWSGHQIKVVVMDAAGNTTEAIWTPVGGRPFGNFMFLLIGALVAIIGFGLKNLWGAGRLQTKKKS